MGSDCIEPIVAESTIGFVTNIFPDVINCSCNTGVVLRI